MGEAGTLSRVMHGRGDREAGIFGRIYNLLFLMYIR